MILPTIRLPNKLIVVGITSTKQNRPMTITNHFGNPIEQEW
jgi:hypothetical protein